MPMTKDYIEWLTLSQPKNKAKTVKQQQAVCPHCGWPVSKDVDICPHCQQQLGDTNVPDVLTDLSIKLLRPVININPPPAGWFDDTLLDSLEMYDLRLQAERLRVRGGFDRLICLDDIEIDQYQHQLEAALHSLRDMGGHTLLADEVGLGKTIEAGIIMKELIERGLIHKILIIVPASLTWQWHEEMETKFLETFTVLEDIEQLPAPMDDRANAIQRGRWIISLSRARHATWEKSLLAHHYDLLIVDEAHKLRNHRTKAYDLVSQIRKRYVLMLTATPVHNHLMELYNLISILKPGHLGTRTAFSRNFIQSATKGKSKRRAPRRTIYSEDYPADYYKKSYQARQLYLETADTEWLKQYEITEDINEFRATYLPQAGRRISDKFSEVEALLADGYEVFDFEARKKSGFLSTTVEFVCRLKVGPTPKKTEQPPQPKRHITPRNPYILRSLLREVMIRNRRTTVGIRFPPREAAVYHLNFSPPERELYDGVTAHIRKLLRQSEAESASQRKSRGALHLTLMSLQKQLCSSPQAVARSLEKLATRYPDPALDDYLALAKSIKRGRKVQAVLDILEQYPGKILIFTDYLPTMNVLQKTLVEAGYQSLVFHGGLSALERTEAIRAFRGDARVMISTHSGGEGHNLQFCHQMINYDLPWNPMQIEQRIGRIHRLGQKNKVIIFNLSATNTIEAYIIDLLAHKIRMFELVIGELDLVLGEMDSQGSFEDYLQEAWVGSQSEAELLQKIAELESIIGKAHGTYQKIRDASDELSVLFDAG